jgi:hypothetical protein
MDPLSRRDFDRKTTSSLKIELPSGNNFWRAGMPWKVRIVRDGST